MNSPRPERTASDLLVECLEAEGCEFVFSVPGEETMDVLDALSRAERGERPGDPPGRGERDP